MKKLSNILSILLVLVVVFTSCAKDDDDNTSQNQIVGKWQVIESNRIQDGKIVYTNADGMIGVIIEFNSNLSYSIIDQNVLVETGTYIINGSVIGIKETGTNDDYSSATFTISDDTLRVYAQSSDDDDTDEIRETVAKRVN